MSRNGVVKSSRVAVALAAVLAIVWVAVPALAGKPEVLSAASYTPNGDCSVDFEITLESKGRQAAAVVVHYWQQGTRGGANYAYLTSLERGETRPGNVGFIVADKTFGTTYEVGYTAFAKNGQILEIATLGTVDNSDCF
jgi:hypothetical protein